MADLNSEHCVIGHHGFIGGAIARRLGRFSSYPTPNTKIVYAFGSYTHPTFENNPDFYLRQQIGDFSSLLAYCSDYGIKLVYPSSAIVYEKDTQFTRLKRTLESMASCFPAVSIGLRIFPVYGPGETRTFVHQCCDAIKHGRRPVVYGDGSQERDFIYIDDVVSQIMDVSEMDSSRVIDVGGSNPVSFNEIVYTANRCRGEHIQPEYVDKPADYSDGIVCHNPGRIKVLIGEGIQRTLESIAL